MWPPTRRWFWRGATQTGGLIRLAGNVTGAGSLSLNTGTPTNSTRVIVDGNNSYTGPTTISTGSLVGIGSDTAFGNVGTVTFTTPTTFSHPKRLARSQIRSISMRT